MALATLVVGLLGCCAILLSQDFAPANTNRTPSTLAQPSVAPTSRPRALRTSNDVSGLNYEAARQQFNAASEQLALFESTRQGQLAQLKARQADPTETAAAQQRIAAAAAACYEAAARLEHERQLTQSLEAAQTDPSAWSRIPADTLTRHTDLRRLLAELKSAQAHTARMLETRLSAHPAVISARAAEQEIEANLQHELNTVLPERRAAHRTDEQQLTSLRDELQRQETSERQLAESAAEYNLYLTNVRTCEAVLRQTEQDLHASRNTQGASRAVTLKVDSASPSVPAVPQTVAAARELEADTTDNSSSRSGNRLMLILVGGASGLLACLSYFYLTSSRPTVHNLTEVTSTGHCQSETTAAAATAVASSAADDHGTINSTHTASVLPLRVTPSEPSRVTGRTTLRDALMRVADRAQGSQASQSAP